MNDQAVELSARLHFSIPKITHGGDLDDADDEAQPSTIPISINQNIDWPLALSSTTGRTEVLKKGDYGLRVYSNNDTSLSQRNASDKTGST